MAVKSNQQEDMKEILRGFKQASLEFLGKYEGILERIAAMREKQVKILQEASKKLDDYKLSQARKKLSK